MEGWHTSLYIINEISFILFTMEAIGNHSWIVINTRTFYSNHKCFRSKTVMGSASYHTVCVNKCQTHSYLGHKQLWGLLGQYLLFHPSCSELSKHWLIIEYQVYILQHSCNDTCEIWIGFRGSDWHVCKMKISIFRMTKLMVGALLIPIPGILCAKQAFAIVWENHSLTCSIVRHHFVQNS